jgi:hypothetical protein
LHDHLPHNIHRQSRWCLSPVSAILTQDIRSDEAIQMGQPYWIASLRSQ